MKNTKKSPAAKKQNRARAATKETAKTTRNSAAGRRKSPARAETARREKKAGYSGGGPTFHPPLEGELYNAETRRRRMRRPYDAARHPYSARLRRRMGMERIQEERSYSPDMPRGLRPSPDRPGPAARPRNGNGYGRTGYRFFDEDYSD